jgi:hypothetical protein
MGIAALALVVVVSGFALSRGYLMRFVVNGADISRDEYYRRAYASLEDQTSMYCTSGATLGFVYLWEVQCFSTPDELDNFMS